MDIDSAALFYFDDLDMDVKKPLAPPSGGFDFMPWATPDGGCASISGAYFRDASYGPISSPDFEGNYLGLDGFDAVNHASYSTDPLAASPAEAGLSGSSSPAVDSDSELSEVALHDSPLALTPESCSSKKRAGTVEGGPFGSPEAATAHPGALPPPKRLCPGTPEYPDDQGKMTKASAPRARARGKAPPHAPGAGSPDDSKPKTNRKQSGSGHASTERKPSSSSSSSSSLFSPSSPPTLGARGGPGRKHKAQLRTACRRRKGFAAAQSSSSPPAEDPQGVRLTPEERRARQNHNIVEKQYRNRLNYQFESLLAILPASRSKRNSGGDGGDGGGGNRRGRSGSSNATTTGGVGAEDRRLSKAEVLEMARQRIKTLEKEQRALELERDELLGNVVFLRDAVAGRPLA